MQCLILAGGLATRMRPMTEKIPKALIEINGKPFADYQLDWLERNGVTEVIYSVGYRGKMLQEHVESLKSGMRIRFVDEGENLRGTGGAIRFALDCGTLDEAFLVTYGDSFLPVDFAEVWQYFLKSGEQALMTVFKNEGQWDKSNVWYEDGKIRLYDKHGAHPEFAAKLNFIDYGLSAFRRDLIEQRVLPQTKSDLAEVLYSLSREGKLAGFPVQKRFYEIGSPQGLEDFTQFVNASH